MLRALGGSQIGCTWFRSTYSSTALLYTTLSSLWYFIHETSGLFYYAGYRSISWPKLNRHFSLSFLFCHFAFVQYLSRCFCERFGFVYKCSSFMRKFKFYWFEYVSSAIGNYDVIISGAKCWHWGLAATVIWCCGSFFDFVFLIQQNGITEFLEYEIQNACKQQVKYYLFGINYHVSSYGFYKELTKDAFINKY